jgi:bacillithiol biosynthesis deacetylase BshB1
VTRPVDVLAIGAHPDDVEVGCGGALILASDAGLHVAVADLTSGEAASRGTRREREGERTRAAEILGVTTRSSLGLPDGGVGTDTAHRRAVIRLIRELGPRVVLAPYEHDRHPDHAAAGRLAREASFLAGLARIGEGPPHRPAHVYHYMVHYPFPASFVVDVSRVWARKWDAILAHRSQFGSDEGSRAAMDPDRYLEVVGAWATLHGAMIGVERGEAFHYPGPLPLVTLPGLAPEDGDAAPSRYQIFH